LDKFLLPILGALKADELSRKIKFRFAWSIMASYGALAAVMLKMRNRHINFLLSYDSTQEKSKGSMKSRIFSPIYKLIFRSADTIYLSDASLEKKSKFFSAATILTTGQADNKELIDQIRYSFVRLLNKQERKLERPL
jgi:hypothetical protein